MRSAGPAPRRPDHPRPGPLPGLLDRLFQGARCQERHRGTTVMRKLLAERDPGYAPPESEGEALFYALIEGSNLPLGVRQFPVWDGKRWRRLDYAWPNPGVGTEFDGWETHGTRAAFQDDRTRDRGLQIRGWRVLHYTAEDVR